MLTKTIFAGFGGQGVMLMGVCLATAAMNEGKHVTFLPSYGAEVRGGTANCTVSISTEEIASPIASSPDYILAMNAPSMERFRNFLRPNGTFITNSTLIEAELLRPDVHEIRVPGSGIAEGLGSMRITNMVMLGAYAAASNIVSFRVLLDAVNTVAGAKKKELAELNIKAVQAGCDYVREFLKSAEKKKQAPAKEAGEELA